MRQTPYTFGPIAIVARDAVANIYLQYVCNAFEWSG